MKKIRCLPIVSLILTACINLTACSIRPDTPIHSVVDVGSISINNNIPHDRNVRISSVNRIGVINIGDNASVDTGTICYQDTQVKGNTVMMTDNYIPGGIRTNLRFTPVVRIGVIKSY